jgi:predicted  nucleic acid-binding Zn-ribbon protein
MNTILGKLLKLQSLEFGHSTIEAQVQIRQLRAQIPSAMLHHFDRFTARGKQGLAVVRNQVCSGCHLRVPVGIFAALMHGDQVETCASCGRYLYLPKVPAQEMPQARSEASLLSSAKNA